MVAHEKYLHCKYQGQMREKREKKVERQGENKTWIVKKIPLLPLDLAAPAGTFFSTQEVMLRNLLFLWVFFLRKGGTGNIQTSITRVGGQW